MKRTIVKVSLIVALAFAMPVSFTSCKDYDSDIEALNKQNGDLSSQLSALEAALTAAKQEVANSKQAAADAKAAAENAKSEGLKAADEASKKAAAAQAAADAAKAEAEIAKQAAATAKAEAIAEAINECKALIAAGAEAAKEQINLLGSKIEGIEKTLNTLASQEDLNELAKEQEALKVQIATLQEFQKLATEQLGSLSKDIKALAESVGIQVTELKDLISGKAAELQAKIDRINAEIEKINNSISANQKAISDLKDKAADLQSKIDALNTTTGNHTTEINSLKDQIKSINEQIDAKQKLIDGLRSDVDALAKTVANNYELVTTDITELKKVVAEHTAKLTELEKQIKDLSDDWFTTDSELKTLRGEFDAAMAKITADFGTISNDLNTMIGTVTLRLTGVTFFPTTYVSGIPAIDFASVAYKPMTKDAKLDKYSVKEGEESVYTSAKAVAKFYTTPQNFPSAEYIQLGGIKVMGHDAQSRSIDQVSSLVSIDGTPSYADGIITVTLNKVNEKAQFSKDNKGKVNVVAVEVPLGDASLLASEKAAGTRPVVYSDYVSLTEKDAIDAAIAKKGQPSNHFSSYDSAYGTYPSDSKADFTVPYDGKLDLTELVAGCTGDNHAALSVEELKAYGLELRFALAGDEYKDNDELKTEQQQAFKLANGVVAPKTANKGYIGRVGIVKITLIDTNHNNNIVDVRYAKVTVTAVDMTPIEMNKVEAAIDLGLKIIPVDDNKKNIYGVNYEQMQALYNGYTPEGISKEDFYKIYAGGTVAIETISPKGWSTMTNVNAAGAKVAHGEAGITTDLLSTSTSSDPIKVSIGATYCGKVLPATSKYYVAKITFTNKNGLYPDAVIYVKYGVNLTIPAAGVLSEIQKLQILPVQCEEGWMKTKTSLRPPFISYYTTNKVEYNFDFYGLFNNRIMMTPGNPVGTSDLQFTKKNESLNGMTAASTSYVGKADPEVYKLKSGGNTAAFINWGTHTQWNSFLTPNNSDPKIKINNDVLIHEQKTVELGSFYKINDFNYDALTTYQLKIIRPLNVITKNTGHYFEDGLIEGSRVSIADAVSMVDFRGYKVAKKNGEAEDKAQFAAYLWDYYGVTTPVWSTKETLVTTDANLDANVEADLAKMSLLGSKHTGSSVSEDGEDLVFKTTGASIAIGHCYLWIPVEVKYAFGTFNKYIQIEVKEANSPNPTSRRK